MTLFQLGLRRSAARLSRSSLVCGQCVQYGRAIPSSKPLSIVGIAVASRGYSTPAKPLPIASLAQEIHKTKGPNTHNTDAKDVRNDRADKKSTFPETNSKSVGYWLLGSATSVFGIVVFGGLTRLTESGYV